MARKHNYFRYDVNTDTMETARLRRRQARDGGWSTDRTTARRRAASRVSMPGAALQAELGRIAAMDRDGLRRLAVERDIAGRRNKGKAWLLTALAADAKSRFVSKAA